MQFNGTLIGCLGNGRTKFKRLFRIFVGNKIRISRI